MSTVALDGLDTMTPPGEDRSMSDDVTGPQISHHEARERYEIRHDDAVAGFAQYTKAPGLVVFTHTEIRPEHEGKGLAGQLIRFALDDVREAGSLVLPICPFVQAYMQRHPEYGDLDYREQRPAE